ncbi:NHLP family bacteriocin export ABC transporter peptidase/permease/ATPase subunit [Candidatus Pseudoruminococcus sp.]|uniref:NHLP family bacteriocin export ABC transporter peptidase/permease/ATPase subunit n=1 Tax=Candidatus Pseudoruminococcus sp. TaxID=3101048 RepID=UPI00399B776F
MSKLKKLPKAPVTKGVAKVPVVIQLEALECGAASLTMILAYYGKWVPLERVRADCGVSRDGSNAKNIFKAAQSYGMDVKAYRFEPDALRKNGKFPCIIHWNFNHFVVLCGFRGNKAVINDPAKGNYTVSMEHFDKTFTGICLIFSPDESFKPEGKPKSIFSFARKKLIGTGSEFSLVVITTIITSLIGIITPAFSNFFADYLLLGYNPEWLMPFIWGVSGLAIIQIIVEIIKAVYSLKANGKIAIVANSEYIWHVLRLPMEFFSQRMAGDISERKSQNATIAGTLISTFAPLVIQFFMMIFYLFVMLKYSWILSCIGILSIVINVFVSRYISKKRINLTRVTSRDSGKLSGATVAGIEMIESIKASGAENGFFEKWSGYQASVNSGTAKFTKLNAYLGIIPSVVSVLTNAVVFMGSVYLFTKGLWTVGMITAFSGFLSSFLSPAMQFVSASQTLQEMRTSMERIDDVMKYPTDIEYSDKDLSEDMEFSKLTGKIELKNVTFGYSRLEEPLIKDFSMTIEPGEHVAFVGPSGCGKSTLSKLISGLYKPWSGEILFDGKPISQINRSVFTGSLSVVDQDIILFEDTIANNIKMWDSSIEDFEMILAARDAQIHDDIMQRDGGYQYRLIEGGMDLSGGQRQRLEIARVLAEDPTIIIMDEATSALDAKTEYNVVKSIEDRGITCIIVAHRLSTIRDCDEIIVLDRGKVIERGTHDELYSNNGAYARLVSNE